MENRIIYLLRHGHIQVPEGVFVGQNQLPLSPKGVCQAEQLSEFFVGTGVRWIVSSTLVRSKQTAEILSNKLRTPTFENSDLNEINMGDWEGRTRQWLKENQPRKYEEREKSLFTFRFPNGESFLDLQQRGVNCLFEILSRHDGVGLIVGHKSINRVILSSLLPQSLHQMFNIPQPYGCINQLKFLNGQWNISINQSVGSCIYGVE